jgi:hypothetical protein
LPDVLKNKITQAIAAMAPAAGLSVTLRQKGARTACKADRDLD